MTKEERKAARAAAKAAKAAEAEQVTELVTEDAPTTEAPAEVIEPEAPVTEAIVEDVVEAIEAVEGEPAKEETPAEEPAVEDAPASEQDFDAVLAGISADDAKVMALRVASAFDERADFERVLDPDNSKIQKTLSNTRAKLIELGAARVLIATNIDPEVINRSIHEGARYNVYAIQKLADACSAVGYDGRGVANAINNACMRSLFRFRAAKLTFTGEMAKAAASDKIRIDRAIAQHLVRHTVSPSTAPTQASSTMQALETMGVVRRSGSGRNPTFELTGNPIVSKLEKVLGIAA
jgi:hypothetical protein